MAAGAASASEGPLVVLGAGYAGVRLAREVSRRAQGGLPVVLVDRHPVHVLRTELYEVGKLARAQGAGRRLAIPIDRVLRSSGVEFRSSSVERLDLDAHRVHLGDGELTFRYLAICLGSTIAYYGVPGAPEHTHQVYRYTGALRLAAELKAKETASAGWPKGQRPEVVVVGGGSTGTEVAAEIATTDWRRVAGPGARAPHVTLVAGAVPFLAGLPDGLVQHARELLKEAGVDLSEGVNVTRVESDHLALQDGTNRGFHVAVWCAGVQAPPLVRAVPGAHGKAGRLKVNENLELPDRPGVFAVGDVAEFEDPRTHMLVPATAQAALAEASVAAANVVHRWRGEPMERFVYREKGMIVAVGTGKASGSVRRLTVWGSPAALLKRLTEREYSASAGLGRAPPGL
ncbi:MAG: FAD-dependent oxidoreductase [Thermoplasmata archaeon]|nr:FAD-dependent oxidoreductase [Thermoplasmata archaeon]